MAESSIKVEEDIKLNKDENLKNDIPHMIPDPRWKTASSEDDHTRVLLLEAAASHAMKALNAMLQRLKNRVGQVASAQPRIDAIESIILRKKEFQVYIGFAGSTGAGKTTVVNALLGYANLLPDSPNRACTAVVVEVSYNKSNEADSRFRATIAFITMDELRVELSQMFADIEAKDKEDDDEEGEYDEAREARINEMMNKIKVIFPDIRSVAKLKTTSVENLLTRTSIKDVLGSTIEIHSANRKKFSAEIRQIIDCGTNSRKASYWPLVKLVKIFVKNSFLESGITLVDLPGSSDSNAVRSSVAEKYQRKLSVTIIVADGKRGISEANAHDVLEKVTKRNMQMDGLYTSDSLCFVLSHNDRAFNVATYMDYNPELQIMLAADCEAVSAHKKRIKVLDDKLAIARQASYEGVEVTNKLTELNLLLRSRLDASADSSTALSPHRKRSAQDIDSVSEPSRANTEQISLRQEIARNEKDVDERQSLILEQAETIGRIERNLEWRRAGLFFARSNLRKACIHDMNEASIDAIRRDYEDNLAQIGRTVTAPLPVFCVASTLYLQYKHTDKREHGFPSELDTGIPLLRDWLVSRTFKDRESCAHEYLEEVESFLDSNVFWLKDQYGEFKMPRAVRASWESTILEALSNMKNQFNQLSISSSQIYQQLVHENLYAGFPQLEKVASKLSRRKPEIYSKLNWSTHRAINKRCGRWVDAKKGKEHKWNEDIADDFAGVALKTKWDQTFQVGFLAQKATYIQKGKALISDFATLASERCPCPELSGNLGVLKNLILKNQGLLEAQTDRYFQEIFEASKDAHRNIAPAVTEFLMPMYEQAGVEHGTGHFARNIAQQKYWFGDRGEEMHHAVTESLKESIDRLLSRILSVLEYGREVALQHIQDWIKQYLDENTATGARNSARRVISRYKVNLSKELMISITELSDAWTSDDGSNKVDEEDNEDDALLFDNSDLFAVEGKDPDADYQAGDELV